MHPIRATARYTRAIQSTAELLAKLRVESIFVGNVARSAWLGTEVDRGAVDVLALLNGPQKNQLAMMASNRGYRVEKDELEASVEFDLVPLHFVDPEGEVRVHVLLASNALYGRMVSVGLPTTSYETIRVPSREDFALLLLMSDDHDAVQQLAALPDFDRRAFDDRLVAIGLGGRVIGA